MSHDDVRRIVGVATVCVLFVDFAAIGVNAAFTVGENRSSVAIDADQPGVAASRLGVEEALAGNTETHRPGATPASVVGERDSTTNAPPRRTGSSASEHSAPVVTGRGITPNELVVGFQVTTNIQAGLAAVGANTNPPEERAIVETLVERINASGGIGGRQIVPVVHETDPSAGTWTSQAQAACATFTEDNQVFAVGSSPTGGSDALLACLAGARTPLIEQNLWLFDDEYYRQFAPYLYQPGKMSPTRWARAYADVLASAGFFAGEPQAPAVGLARFDAPVFHRLAKDTLRPALESRGVRIAEEVAITSPASLADFGSTSSQVSAAILRFRASGVERVLFLENAGILPFFWLSEAEAQGYRPRYGLTSIDIPTTLSSQSPPDQLQGALVVGFNPANDVYPRDNPGGAAWERCQARTDAGSINKGGPIYTFFTDPICDTFQFLEHVVPRLRDATAAALAEATHTLGASYESPQALLTRFGPGRFDGASAVRLAAFDDGCVCFRYTSDAIAVP